MLQKMRDICHIGIRTFRIVFIFQSIKNRQTILRFLPQLTYHTRSHTHTQQNCLSNYLFTSSLFCCWLATISLKHDTNITTSESLPVFYQTLLVFLPPVSLLCVCVSVGYNHYIIQKYISMFFYCAMHIFECQSACIDKIIY